MLQSRHLAAYVVPWPPPFPVSGTKKVKEATYPKRQFAAHTHPPYRILFSINSSFAPKPTIFELPFSVWRTIWLSGIMMWLFFNPCITPLHVCRAAIEPGMNSPEVVLFGLANQILPQSHHLSFLSLFPKHLFFNPRLLFQSKRISPPCQSFTTPW